MPIFIFSMAESSPDRGRVAGNAAADAAIGSIEYGVEHLGSHPIVVLGHSRCGAVTAAIEGGEFAEEVRNARRQSVGAVYDLDSAKLAFLR
jgi:carbonic anhydrase